MTVPINPQIGHLYSPDGTDLGIAGGAAGLYGNSYFVQSLMPDGRINTMSVGWGRGQAEVNQAAQRGYTLDPGSGQWIAPQGQNTDPQGGPLLAAVQSPTYQAPLLGPTQQQPYNYTQGPGLGQTTTPQNGLWGTTPPLLQSLLGVASNQQQPPQPPQQQRGTIRGSRRQWFGV